jgi:hypothetical protein
MNLLVSVTVVLSSYSLPHALPFNHLQLACITVFISNERVSQHDDRAFPSHFNHRGEFPCLSAFVQSLSRTAFLEMWLQHLHHTASIGYRRCLEAYFFMLNSYVGRPSSLSRSRRPRLLMCVAFHSPSNPSPPCTILISSDYIIHRQPLYIHHRIGTRLHLPHQPRQCIPNSEHLPVHQVTRVIFHARS